MVRSPDRAPCGRPATAAGMARPIGFSSAAYRRHQVHFAVRPDRREPRVLEDLAVDGDGIAALEVRRELRIAVAERTEQLAHVMRLDLDFRHATGNLAERAAKD